MRTVRIGQTVRSDCCSRTRNDQETVWRHRAGCGEDSGTSQRFDECHVTNFRDFFLDRLEKGGFTTEDALASFLPLMRQVVATHAAGLVAPLAGVEQLQVDGLRIFYDETRRRSPSLQTGKIREFEKAQKRAV